MLYPADVLATAAALLVAEFWLYRRSYCFLSPMAIFVISFSFLYIFPFAYHSWVREAVWLSRLSVHELDSGIGAMRVFFYTSTITIAVGMARTRRHTLQRIGAFTISDRTLVILVLAYIPVFFLYVGAGVGFSLPAMFDRLVNPRAYTHIRTGFGPLVYLKLALNTLALFVATSAFLASPRSLLRVGAFSLIVSLTLLAGNKTSLMITVLFFVLLRQKHAPATGPRIGRAIRATRLGLLALPALPLAFLLYSSDADTRARASIFLQIVDYQREAHHTCRVVSDWRWSPDHLAEAAIDTAIAPVPRAIWPGKPLVGFYKRHWQSRYEPTAPVHHTSTYGSLAEAHMVLGPLGPPLYGFLFALLVLRCQKRLLLSQQPAPLYRTLITTVFLFFLLRHGVTGTTPWSIWISAAFGTLALRALRAPPRAGRGRRRLVVGRATLEPAR